MGASFFENLMGAFNSFDGGRPEDREQWPRETVEEVRKLKEQLAQLEESHERVVEDILQSLRREQEDNEVAQQSLIREKDEKDTILFRNQLLVREFDDLKRQLESKDNELENLRNELQHSQRSSYEEKLLKGAEEEIRKLRGQLSHSTASHRKAVDESSTLSQSLKRAQEDMGTVQQSLRREREEKDRTLSQSQQLMGELDDLRRQLESKNAELKNFRNEFQHSQMSRNETLLKEAEEEIRKLKGQLSQFTASHRKAVDESTALSQSLKLAQEDVGTIQQSLLREREETDRALLQSQRLRGELGGLRQRVESKDVELKNTQKELHHSQIQCGKFSALLEARNCELKGAQVYPIKADTLSSAEVIALVDALNVEISQTSAFISDSFGFARKSEHAAEVKEASTKVGEFVGATLAHLLGTVSHADDPLLVQIALQGAAVEFLRRIIMAWDFDGLQGNRPLATLYDGIREKETQAVSGRWRALTRAHAQKVALQGDLYAATVAPVSDALVTILVAAGCTKNHEETHQTFMQNFGGQISNIIKMALRMNQALGEEVTSADLEPINVTSGEKFDGATMTNFESSRKNLEGQIVLCTTALGLQRSEKVVQEDVVEFKVTTLLKPKVVLASVADDLNMDEA